MIETDVLIVGSGFSGSIMAMALRSIGRRVVLVERGRHPRFAIGESSTPLANLLLEEIADRYGLPRLRAFAKWGTWQHTHRDVACGLKRGFSFFFHQPEAPFEDGPEHARQLLVAASPHDGIADTHWYRPEFDHALVREAQDGGAIYLDDTHIESLAIDDHGVTADTVRHGAQTRIRADFIVDASGPRGFLHHALGLIEAPLRWLPPTQGLYTHFTGVSQWADVVGSDQPPPYPPDDAALHHVFPGGWIWVLRFNNGVTSAGAALTRPLAEAIGASDGADAWTRLLQRLPSVQQQFAGASATMPWRHTPRLAFRSATVAGDRWAMLPSAAGVIDPLLSTGFPLTLLGIIRLLDVLEHTLHGDERQRRLRHYAEATSDELDATEQLVAALYASMEDVPLFTRLALLYFAAASFSEAARRLGRPQLAPGFLLHAHPDFGSGLRECAARGRTAAR
jgi:tetracycline 7-halogenase / FADH2 O2-dependent halogenase